MRPAPLAFALFLVVSLAGCGMPMFGPCSYGALKVGMAAIDASSATFGQKARAQERFGGTTVECAIRYRHQSEYFIIEARAQLRAGLDYQKAGSKGSARKAFGAAVLLAQASMEDGALATSVRDDANDIVKQADDALNLLWTE